MALYFIESWNGYNSGSDFTARGYTLTNSTYLTLDVTGGRWGDAALKMTARSTGGLPKMTRVMPGTPSGTTLRVAFWIKTTSTYVANGIFSSSSYILSLENSTPSNWIDITLAPEGHVCVSITETQRSSIKGYFLYSMTRLNDGEWHHVELEMTLSTTTGTGKLWIDGVLEHSVTGKDTVDGVSDLSTLTRMTFAAGRLSDAAGHDVWLGPVIVWDDSGTDFTGSLANHVHRVVSLLPTGAGNYANFTPSAGSNYQNVDELSTDNDTTYNNSTTAGHKDTFVYADLPATADAVLGVVISTIARSVTNTPTFRSVSRISGTDYAGATVTLSTSYAAFDQLYGKSPASSSAWTVSEVNNAEFGYEAVAGTDDMRVTRQNVEAIITETPDTLRVTRAYLEVLIKEGSAPAASGGTATSVVVCA